MNVVIEPHALEGAIPAIASKSMAHRLLILAAFAPGITDLDCNTTSKDIEATVGCLEALGARIARTKLGFRVKPVAADSCRRDALLDCGESGSTLRFMLPVLAALGCDASVQVHGRLGERPLSPLWEEMEDHGAELGERGAWPLAVGGRMCAGTFHMPGNVSSQYVSGLLMAAPLMDGPTEVLVEEPFESKSYVDLTCRAMATFGVAVDVSSIEVDGARYVRYLVRAGSRLAAPGVASVEGDWSNSAFWLCAGALGGSGVTVSGLNLASGQGDRACVAALAAYGARIVRGEGSVRCQHDRLRAHTIDVGDIPDLVPPLAAVATQCEGETRIVNAGRLRLKESDRLETVRAGLAALGADIEIVEDSLVIRGGAQLRGGMIDAANDHRIAMMGAIAGAYATGPVMIMGAQCVSKSYPAFFEDFESLGGRVTRLQDGSEA